MYTIFWCKYEFENDSVTGTQQYTMNIHAVHNKWVLFWEFILTIYGHACSLENYEKGVC